MSKPPRRTRARRGFTLLELGIVIGVAAILAAAIVPDIIETMRNRMAEKAAGDVALVHDAARLFYVQNTNFPNRWPGENASGFCATNFSRGKFLNDMLGGGYLTGGGSPVNPLAVGLEFLQNPWGQAYEVSVYAPSAVANPACLFGVSTSVPGTVSNAFIAYLPQASCGLGCPPPAAALPAGFVRCCSFVPKPGANLLQACNGKVPVPTGPGGSLRCPP